MKVMQLQIGQLITSVVHDFALELGQMPLPGLLLLGSSIDKVSQPCKGYVPMLFGADESKKRIVRPIFTILLGWLDTLSAGTDRQLADTTDPAKC